MDDLNETLRTLNDNVARLAVAQIAIANELHMLRQAYEGNPGGYDDPIESEIGELGIEGAIAPEFIGIS